MVSIIHFITFALRFADVAKLVDALDLGSSALRHVGSTPIIRTDRLSISYTRPASVGFVFLIQS